MITQVYRTSDSNLFTVKLEALPYKDEHLQGASKFCVRPAGFGGRRGVYPVEWDSQDIIAYSAEEAVQLANAVLISKQVLESLKYGYVILDDRVVLAINEGGQLLSGIPMKDLAVILSSAYSKFYKVNQCKPVKSSNFKGKSSAFLNVNLVRFWECQKIQSVCMSDLERLFQ